MGRFARGLAAGETPAAGQPAGHGGDDHAEDGHGHDGASYVKPKSLRDGERRVDLATAEPYTPAAALTSVPEKVSSVNPVGVGRPLP